MNCLEFKRLALSDPNSEEPSFVKHGKECPDCIKYIGGVRQMDADLASSIDIAIPDSLMAKIQLNQMLEEEAKRKSWIKSGVGIYAAAACFAFILFVSGFFVSGVLNTNDTIGDDYQALIAGVVEHMNEVPVTPVWNAVRANQSANMHLANYDGQMRLKFLENLQFSRLCPMGQYRGLHAGLDTPDGHVTFAYIKGNKVDDIIDAAYEGYSVRVKPLKDGNLVIVSKNTRSLKHAGNQLDDALYWDI